MDDRPHSPGRPALFAGLLALALLGMAAAATAVWYASVRSPGPETPPDDDPPRGEVRVEPAGAENSAAAVLVRLKADGRPEGDVGELGEVLVKRRGEEGFRVVADGRRGMDEALATLGGRLKELRPKAKGGREPLLVVEADGRLRPRHVARVYDVCKEAGYAQISFAPPSAPGR